MNGMKTRFRWEGRCSAFVRVVGVCFETCVNHALEQVAALGVTWDAVPPNGPNSMLTH